MKVYRGSGPISQMLSMSQGIVYETNGQMNTFNILNTHYGSFYDQTFDRNNVQVYKPEYISLDHFKYFVMRTQLIEYLN